MNHNRVIFTAITSAVLIAIFVVYGQQLNAIPENVAPTENIVVRVPEDWIPYTHDLSGIKVWHPSNFTVEKSGNLSFLLLDRGTQEPTGNTSFIYFSYIPDINNASNGEIYNADKDAIAKFNGIEVNSKISLINDPAQQEWFTYTRDADVTIGSKMFKKFVNQKPWEFPAGTSEVRLIHTDGSRIYMLGAYVQKGKITPEFLNILLDTITFNQAEQEALPIEELDYAAGLDWTVFDDMTYGLKIKHPVSWVVTPAPSQGLGGLVRLAGESNGENVYIEISKHINVTKSKEQSLRDVELSRSPQTVIKEERMLSLNGREVYQQKIEMTSGGADSKKYGVYNIFELDGELYFAELYTDKPFDQEYIVENIVALISK